MIKQKFENEEKRFRFLELKHPGLPRQEGTYFYENGIKEGINGIRQLRK